MQIKRGKPYPLGASVIGGEINFAVSAPEAREVLLILESREDSKWRECVRLEEYRYGDICSARVSGVSPDIISYYYQIDGKPVTDPYGKVLYGKEIWGEEPEFVKNGVLKEKICERKTENNIPLNDTIIYRIHPRGFTRGSQVKHPGTFQGIIEKLPYLKELGVTLIELMPAYDFDEVPRGRSVYGISHGINYWGYTDANYFAPKTSYSVAATGEGAVKEFEKLVSAIHKNGMEIGMEFYFSGEILPAFAMECLKFWVLQYGIDAIHLSCSDEIVRLAVNEPLFGQIKIFSNCYTEPLKERKIRHTASYQEGFLVNARQFLKGDQDKVQAMSHEIRKNPKNTGIINYISNHNTMTLYDAVSYERKYNEANGEQNRDGTDYNYSWNCGAEGETKRKSVVNLRKRQIKNALAMLFLSQGIPMLMAGDECGNTQLGNNNPYNQDNEISWISWKRNKFQKEILEYTKELIRLRKEHGIFHMNEELMAVDYRALGFPDLSYHGSTAWYLDINPANRHFAALYNGAYADSKDNSMYYVAYNMNWQPESFGIPALSKDSEWKMIFSTAEPADLSEGKIAVVPARSIVILRSGKKASEKGRR